MLQDGGLPGGAKPVRLLRHLASLYATPADVDGLVQRLGIDAFAGTTVRRLSGGQKQRVALAAALVGRPEVVFLDEPTAGLDPHARLDVWDLVRETRDTGCAVVVTTHSFEEAERLADHVVIVDHGRAVAEGSVAEVTGERTLEDVYFELTREGSR
jgi:ABC-2 type transport system ATP-binding protein